MFSGKVQSSSFVLFGNVKICISYSTVKFISLNLWKIVCLDMLMPRLALPLLEIEVAVANRSFFDSLPSICILLQKLSKAC